MDIAVFGERVSNVFSRQGDGGGAGSTQAIHPNLQQLDPLFKIQFFSIFSVFLIEYCCWLNKRNQNPRASHPHRPTNKKKRTALLLSANHSFM